MGNRTSVYLDDDLQAAVKASGTPLAELIRRGLGANTANAESDTAVTDLPFGLSASCKLQLHHEPKRVTRY